MQRDNRVKNTSKEQTQQRGCSVSPVQSAPPRRPIGPAVHVGAILPLDSPHRALPRRFVGKRRPPGCPPPVTAAKLAVVGSFRLVIRVEADNAGISRKESSFSSRRRTVLVGKSRSDFFYTTTTSPKHGGFWQNIGCPPARWRFLRLVFLLARMFPRQIRRGIWWIGITRSGCVGGTELGAKDGRILDLGGREFLPSTSQQILSRSCGVHAVVRNIPAPLCFFFLLVPLKEMTRGRYKKGGDAVSVALAVLTSLAAALIPPRGTAARATLIFGFFNTHFIFTQVQIVFLISIGIKNISCEPWLPARILKLPRGQNFQINKDCILYY